LIERVILSAGAMLIFSVSFQIDQLEILLVGAFWGLSGGHVHVPKNAIMSLIKSIPPSQNQATPGDSVRLPPPGLPQPKVLHFPLPPSIYRKKIFKMMGWFFFTTLLKTKEGYPSLSLSEMDGYSSWICVSKRSLDRKKGVMQFNFQSPWLKLDIANTPSPNVHLCDGIFEDCPSKCLRDPCT
jgi:hypothetical protein